jgi:hypothetical protein
VEDDPSFKMNSPFQEATTLQCLYYDYETYQYSKMLVANPATIAVVIAASIAF